MKGHNPAELLSVSPLGDGSFVVKEGNRRIAVRRLLRNPEQMKGHIPASELAKWRALASDPAAKALPHTALVVIGDDHEPWVDRRHLGPQNGVGLVPWDTKMKARRDSMRHGTIDRAAVLLDSLKTRDPDTFQGLEPPKRTYTTFQRLLDSIPARAHLGLEINEKGDLVLMKGHRSMKLIEQVLRDLRAAGDDKLTSRKIHSTSHIQTYLAELDTRVGAVPATNPIVLRHGTGPSKPRKTTRASTGGSDALKAIGRPKASRPGKLYDELAKARRYDMPNAAIAITRIMLELWIDQFATANNLSVGSDKDSEIEDAVAAFREACGRASVSIPKGISRALARAATQAPNLDKKLDVVIAALAADGRLKDKEAQAKRREIHEKESISLLHDAVHRLETVPSIQRVDHILEVLAPVLNAMEMPRP